MKAARQTAKKYDLVCLGGGPAGVPCARTAIAHGKKVCIIEKERLGGICLNKGCVPKKILHCAADLYSDWKTAAEYGLTSGEQKGGLNAVRANWKLLQEKNQEYVRMINQNYVGMCQQMGINLLTGFGKFTSPHTIKVTNGGEEITVEGEHIVIATGSVPVMPKVPGIELAVTSNKFFEMTTLPESIAVVGGGYIGSEIAACLNTFGVKTTILTVDEGILPNFDQELSNIALEHLKKKGILFHPKTELTGIEKMSQNRLKISTKNNKNIEAEMVLMAVGRKPNTAGFGLEDIGIKLGQKKEIQTNEYDETSCPGVYAVGDVNGRILLTPVAKTASKLLADRLFGPGKDKKEDYKMDYNLIPSAGFIDPPIANCGMTEQAAIKTYGKDKVKVHKFRGSQLQHALTKNKEPLVVKVICVEEKVVGMNALGRNVDEMIVGFALAMRKGITTKDLHKFVVVHPTGAEEFANVL